MKHIPVSDDLHEILKDLAEYNRRTIQQELDYRLRKLLENKKSSINK